MFGLQNIRGSCWVNAGLQALYRIPAIQQRYSKQIEKENNVDRLMCTLWESKGEDGLHDFLSAVRSKCIPAGRGVGDAHEFIVYLCDKLSFLDTLCRFQLLRSIQCNHCKKTITTQTSAISFSIERVKDNSLASCIQQTAQPTENEEWTCDDCKQKGGLMKMAIGTFPTCFVFELPYCSAIRYAGVLVVNNHRYELVSIVCYDGDHWITYGKESNAWYIFNDSLVFKTMHFPKSSTTRLLIYSLL